ncbi:hypothetical protein PV10_03002 [Exophiala mesophila]|uniref:Uncharacterized protein n=1 Tax=Exophiala mesophila TaxID=212818 RepID=A0A0D2A8M6_EXOME|nr:uncharacterized protein PV10_03002 [Exophiala mesophila]KIV95333.1 hypothetical protein PV10_03002 [Exophiala mesophila]
MPSQKLSNGSSEYEIEGFYHSQVTSPIKVICIGSGVSGMCLAYKMLKGLESFELTVYEKNKDVGGTMREAVYVKAAQLCWLAPSSGRSYLALYNALRQERPNSGLRIDIQVVLVTFQHIYTLSPGSPNMTGASTTLIQPKSTIIVDPSMNATASNASPSYNTRSRKLPGVRCEDKSQWEVEVEDLSTGKVIIDTCQVLVNATGFLNKWTWPKIKGIETFNRPKLHSAAWDPSVDFQDKTIGLIGTGSSAIQIVPKLQQLAKQLKIFMRSPTWITPAIGGKTSDQFQGDDKADGNTGHEQFTFTDEQKARFKSDPEYHLQFRKKNWSGNQLDGRRLLLWK